MVEWLKGALGTVYGKDGLKGVAVAFALLVVAVGVAVGVVVVLDIDVGALLGL
jgi:hypothetical protein